MSKKWYDNDGVFIGRDLLCNDGSVYTASGHDHYMCVCGEPMESHEIESDPDCPACHGEGRPMACPICHKDWPLITSQAQLERFEEIVKERSKPVGKPLPII